MNQIIEQENINIEDLIFKIRGKQVMLDSDLAHIYHCKNGTKSINLAVNRNKAKFPDDFYFQLTESEYQKLRFQSETTNKMSRTLPYVFTQEGVAMLATVLRTSIASKVSVDIMRAFIKMKRFINYTLDNQNHINNLVFDNYESIKIINQDIKILQDSYNELISKKKVNQIYFNGEYYDAYSNIIDIFKECKEELIIIDSYSDKYTLDLISKINVILITTNKLLNKTDITNYNKQYNNLTIIYNNTFHDRYFILDRDIIFHCGTSLNHIGSKTFSINILDDIEIKEALLNKLNSIIC